MKVVYEASEKLKNFLMPKEVLRAGGRGFFTSGFLKNMMSWRGIKALGAVIALRPKGRADQEERAQLGGH